MLTIYSHSAAVKQIPDRNLIHEICTAVDDHDIEEALIKAGYQPTLTVGKGDLAAIELYLSVKEGTEFGAIALVSLGETIEDYAMATFHDAMDFLKEYGASIKTLCELSEIPFD